MSVWARVGWLIGAHGDADEDQHIDDLRKRRDEIERVQGGDSMNLGSEQKTEQSPTDDHGSGMQTTLIRERGRRDPDDDLPP